MGNLNEAIERGLHYLRERGSGNHEYQVAQYLLKGVLKAMKEDEEKCKHIFWRRYKNATICGDCGELLDGEQYGMGEKDPIREVYDKWKDNVTYSMSDEELDESWSDMWNAIKEYCEG